MAEVLTRWTFFIIDVSSSMAAKDFPPSRLRAACEATKAFVRERCLTGPNDRVGIVAFSDRASLRLEPISVRRESDILRALNRLKADGGTDFAAGLEVAGKVFARQGNPHPVQPGLLERLFGTDEPAPGPSSDRFSVHAVFCSDGHDYGDRNPVAIANKLKSRYGVVLECIGIGGSPKEVDEKRLRAMASVGPAGHPLYRFIGDTDKLIQEFRRMAAIQIC